MKRRAVLVAAVVTASLAATTAPPPVPKSKPKVEVVFCLDTTGSMGGLIEGAKQKVWSICNQIAGGTPTPDVRVGLVAYRDKGDAYVTKVHDLSDDLDAVHGHLRGFQAAGGGDVPEHVNQALHDAVNKMSWSADKRTLKIVFLVGDAPPHVDYKDDVQYPETCKKAVQMDVIINAIQCGRNAECTKYWKDVAAKSEGSYAAIEQDGGVRKAMATPQDGRLAAINRELADCTLGYGTVVQQKDAEKKKGEAKALSVTESADRAGFSGKSGRGTSYDLVQAVQDKKVDLAKLKEAELPEELRKLKTNEERQEYVRKVQAKREALNREAVELDRKRAEYLAQQAKKDDKRRDGFDEQVLLMLRRQAGKHKIDY